MTLMTFAHPPHNQQAPALSIHDSRGVTFVTGATVKELTVCQSSDNLSGRFVAGRGRLRSRKIHPLPGIPFLASLKPSRTIGPACGTAIVGGVAVGCVPTQSIDLKKQQATNTHVIPLNPIYPERPRRRTQC